ncbi:DEAD/DEAH box helicase [Microcoleus sp. FACHB-1515]|uniref:DEAD/DEAH box helicase n=1 Tax=Cyanophyceae TaxID=3028117 RepID=UPI0019B164CF|nr:DEAD/DEAH box helicase [Microcoleus sp. FACHB-1515]MBD2089651.1 DEAD/DEAH box helicase [Microcoleus sp. FACHB-1515]
MNPIRWIAKQITRKASGVCQPEIYPVSDCKIQSPLIAAKRFRLPNVLVSADLHSAVVESRSSANLLPQIPKIHEISEPFNKLDISAYASVEIATPEILELTDWLAEAACSRNHVETLAVPNIYRYRNIEKFRVAVLTDWFFALDIPQILEDFFATLDRPEILKCCFSQNGQQGKIQSIQEPLRKRKNIQEGKDKALFKSPSYCEILHPILLPPLHLEDYDSLDFYSPLRDYQKQGVKFLFDNQSALLADEMGTGKTVQAVNALRLLFRQAHIRSVLIVCPPAVIGSVDLSIETGNSEGWRGHLYHWASELQVAVMHGMTKEQRRLNWCKLFHVYITTYDTLRGDLTEGVLVDLQQFDCVILDEAQKVKNRNTKTARAIYGLQTNYRWALTGTPVENRLDDVKALFDFIRPGTFLGSAEYSPQDVSSTIKPFVLRRLKQDVLQDLPDKERQEVWLDLDTVQQNAYDQVLDAGRRKIETSLNGEQASQTKSHIFALITQLKQICNFAKEETTSPKAKVLLETLETIAANQKKVLVFSQYRTQGTDKIAKLLTQAGIRYVFYKGSQEQKNQALSDFKNKSEVTVFLSTIQTAGYGITLTEATYVIHFDHPWNPARMQNAEDRVHRFGQEKGVTIYSFWMKNTIEERIKKKLIDKRILIDNTINSLAVGVDDDKLLSTEDWLDIFDIKLVKKTVNGQADVGKLDQKIQARRLVGRSNLQNNQNKLSPPSDSSRLMHEVEQIKRTLETLADSSQRMINVQGNHIYISVKELTLMSDQQPVFNQQGATIGVNYAAKDSNPKVIQNVQNTQNSSETALAAVVEVIQALKQKNTLVKDEQQALSIIDAEFKEIRAKQLPQWRDLINVKRLWNGGKKAAVKVAEHFTESDPWGKGFIAFLEGVSEDIE